MGDFQLGDVVGGRYRLDRELGEGGMGTVYVALDQRLERAVALKVMSAQLEGSEEAVGRFRREALASSRVRHPNIIEVYDADVEGGTPWIAMELLEGESLGEYLKRAPTLSAEETVWLAEEVLAALEVVHAGGFIHRDLKPDNLYLERIRSGGVRLKILDFGIARSTGTELGRLTQTGSTIGTPWYLSPEQARAVKDLDGRSDLYALGVILYEGLSGRRPIEAESYEDLVYRLFTEEPRPIRETQPGVPASLERVIHRALRKAPGERFADARAMRQAIADAGLNAIPIGPESRTLSPSFPGTGAEPVAREPARRRVAPTAPMEPEGGSRSPVRTVASSDARTPRVVAPTALMTPQDGPAADALDRPYAQVSPVPKAAMSAGTPMAAEVAEHPRRSTGLFVGLGAAGAAAIAVVAVVVATSMSGPDSEEQGVAATGDSARDASTDVASTPVEDTCLEGMVAIPGGSFMMGSPAGEGEDRERPQHRVTLPTFCMDRTEATVRAYQACVGAGRCGWPGTQVGCNGADRAEHPINCVSWDDAVAYCSSRDARLPTEAEWEYAARGTDGRTYPWGDQAPGDRLLRWSGGCGDPTCIGGTSPVGSYPAGASPSGVLDMAGNVWEWTGDWYGPYAAGSAVSPQGADQGQSRVQRGGGWLHNQPGRVRAANRFWGGPGGRGAYLGFRCARGGS